MVRSGLEAEEVAEDEPNECLGGKLPLISSAISAGTFCQAKRMSHVVIRLIKAGSIATAKNILDQLVKFNTLLVPDFVKDSPVRGFNNASSNFGNSRALR